LKFHCFFHFNPLDVFFPFQGRWIQNNHPSHELLLFHLTGYAFLTFCIP
jgi:hypothetical protein